MLIIYGNALNYITYFSLRRPHSACKTLFSFLSFIHSFQQFAFLSDTSVTFWVWWVTVIVSSILWPQTRNALVITLKFVSVRRLFLKLCISSCALRLCVSARARPRSETVTLEIENRFYVSLSISIFFNSIYFFSYSLALCWLFMHFCRLVVVNEA